MKFLYYSSLDNNLFQVLYFLKEKKTKKILVSFKSQMKKKILMVQIC